MMARTSDSSAAQLGIMMLTPHQREEYVPASVSAPPGGEHLGTRNNPALAPLTTAAQFVAIAAPEKAAAIATGTLPGWDSIG